MVLQEKNAFACLHSCMWKPHTQVTRAPETQLPAPSGSFFHIFLLPLSHYADTASKNICTDCLTLTSLTMTGITWIWICEHWQWRGATCHTQDPLPRVVRYRGCHWSLHRAHIQEGWANLGWAHTSHSANINIVKKSVICVLRELVLEAGVWDKGIQHLWSSKEVVMQESVYCEVQLSSSQRLCGIEY
jgi:hypothetical protein